MLNVLLFILIGIITYLSLEILNWKEMRKKVNEYVTRNNQKHYDEVLKYFKRNKALKMKEKLNYFTKLNILINRCGLTRNILINSISLVIIGLALVSIFYVIIFGFLKIVVLSAILSIPAFYIPYIILKYYEEYKQMKIEKVFLGFLLQLKNHVHISNDIIYAMKEVKIAEPLNSYIKTFLAEISSGIKFEVAIQNFEDKIEIVQFKEFLRNLKHCYMYGGSFEVLINKSYNMISEIQAQKTKRKEETQGARIVLFILIFLDVLVYISFIKSDEENYYIMRKTILGNMIIYWNFISMLLLIRIANKVKKLDY